MTDTRTEASNTLEQTVRTALKALESGDTPYLDKVLTDDFVYRLTGSHPLSCQISGKAGFLAMVGQVKSMFDDKGVSFTIERFILADNVAIVTFNGTGTLANGQAYRNDYCTIWDWKNDEIAGLTEYFDSQHVCSVML